MLTPLRRRDFRTLWAGMAVSLIGDGVFLVAVAWQAYSISHSPSTLAYVGLATSLPQVIFVLLGGAVSDRLPRRSVLVAADLARAAVLAGLAAMVAARTARLYELCITGAVIGTATAFSSPAFEALVPQLVPHAELGEANAIDQFVRPGALQLAGPALGGLAVAAFGPASCFALDACSFVFSALCALRLAPIPLAATTKQSLAHDMLDGLRYVRRHAWLWATFASASLTYLLFLGPTQVLLPYLVRYSLRQGASTYGWVLAIGGAGALCGALLAGHWRAPRNAMLWAYLSWAVATLAVAGYGLATNVTGLACAAVVVNGAEAAGAVVWATLKQRRVENVMLGRVSSVDWCISTAFLPLSYAVTAPVAHFLGARNTLVGAGVLGALVTLAFLLVPGVCAPDAEVSGALVRAR